MNKNNRIFIVASNFNTLKVLRVFPASPDEVPQKLITKARSRRFHFSVF